MKSVYGNVDAYLLWLILMAKCLINECNMTRSKSNSCIFYKKDYNGKLEFMMSIREDDMFMVGRLEILDIIQ